jgi:hypothetical protein
MFPDSRIVWWIRQEQNKDLRRAAERERLRRAAAPARSRFRARVLASIGGLLRGNGSSLRFGLGQPRAEVSVGRESRPDQWIVQSLEAVGKPE